MRDLRSMAAMISAGAMLTAEEQLADIRRVVREQRQPSGKNRDKIKAARKQRRKSK